MNTRTTVLLGSHLLLMMGAGAALADAPRGSSYAPRPDEAPPPVETLIDGDATVDLTVKAVPAKPKMKMRPAAAKKSTAQVEGDAPAEEPAPESAAAAPAASASADETTSVSAGYKRFPTSARDLRERVAFRIRAGVALDTAPANGDTLRGGFPLSDGFTDTRPWVTADAVVGARGILVPTLNGYFMGRFMFDTSDAIVDRTATVDPSDSFGEELTIKAGYAEYGREDRKPDDQQPAFWLRAGRQFRLDGGNLFAYFDGATIGYRQPSWNASVFGGQRVALYVETEPGILFGGTFNVDLKKAIGINGKMYANYTGLQIESNDFDNDGEKDAETRHLMQVGGSVRAGKKARLDVRARLTGLADVLNTNEGEIPATKFALGRVGGRFEYEAGKLIFVVDAEQRFKDDIAYDLAAASSVDIVDIADKVSVGMNTPVDATTLGARVDWMNSKRNFELAAFARTELPSETPVTVDTKAYLEGGLAVAGTPIGIRGSGVYTILQYTYRQYTDEGEEDGMRIDGVCVDLTDDDMDGIPDECQDFGNSASSGLDRMQQLAAEAVLASRGSGGKRWRVGAGGFFRVYDIRTPYTEVTNDARGGGRVDVQWWFSRDLHLDVAGELAQPSPTLSREIGLMTSVRAAVEARW